MDGLPDCRVYRHLLGHQQAADGVHGVLVAEGGEDQVLGVGLPRAGGLQVAAHALVVQHQAGHGLLLAVLHRVEQRLVLGVAHGQTVQPVGQLRQDLHRLRLDRRRARNHQIGNRGVLVGLPKGAEGVALLLGEFVQLHSLVLLVE